MWLFKQHVMNVRRGNKVEVSEHLHIPATSPRGKSLRFPLGVPLSRNDAAEGRKTYLPRLEPTPGLFHCPALKLGYNCSHVKFSVGVLLQVSVMATVHVSFYQ
jgi:hypothetical protein